MKKLSLSGTQKDKKNGKYQAGITPLLVLVAIATSSIMVFTGGLTVSNLIENGILNFADPALKKLISQQADYLDAAKLNKTYIEDGVVGTVLLPDGSYSAYKILDGDVESKGTKFTGEVKISFFSEDVGLGDYSDGNINPFYLKDGTTTTGVIVDRMLANLNDGETTHIIKILKGTVVNGTLVGQFVAQTLDTGYYIGGIIDSNRKITDATVLTGAPRLTEAQISIADNAIYALSLFKGISADFNSSGENKVLGAKTSASPQASLGKLNKPVF
ncbi:MAG: hypothetical protein PHU71_07125, partial [Candidatus Gracilibacteria bacterium]|nr:hypothetical protein [Candidatus Gracilibacteria bacterium]